MILEAVVFFALLLVTTMLLAVLPGTISRRFWITLPARRLGPDCVIVSLSCNGLPGGGFDGGGRSRGVPSGAT
jgi:hypothetical protein